jgi:hypothetical protein
MITFDKLIIVSGNKYSVRNDAITDLSTLFSDIFDVNTTMILVLKFGIDTYTVDVGKLVSNHHEFLSAINIHKFIEHLTPEIIYSYRTDKFNQMRMIRSFMSHDLPGTTMVSPCNIETGEMSKTTYDPAFPDMVITCDKYDLSKVFPIINNKMKNCSWGDKKIFLKQHVSLVKETSEITFLSFGDTTVTVKSLHDVAADNWNVLPNTVLILVLAGSMFYDTQYIYHTTSKNVLVLNQSFIMDECLKRGFISMDDIINDQDSFVIMVHTNQILVRDVLMANVSKDANVSQHVYYENIVQSHHIDYICIDNKDSTIHGITVADEFYHDVATGEYPKEHHVYTNGGSGDMRLIQLAVC